MGDPPRQTTMATICMHALAAAVSLPHRSRALPTLSKQALPRTRGYILTDVYGCTQARASKLVVRAGAELPANYKTVKPVADRVFVMAAVKEEKSMGGILLPS